MNQRPDMSSVPLKTEHVVLMAIGTGGIVANIYYIQPLLSLIASHFAISATSAGTVAMLSQLGTALGMFFFVPLGDTKERRGLIVKLLLAACICLVAMATARNLWWLATASFGIGLTAATVHVIVPYAAHLAPEGTQRQRDWNSDVRPAARHFAGSHGERAAGRMVRMAFALPVIRASDAGNRSPLSSLGFRAASRLQR